MKKIFILLSLLAAFQFECTHIRTSERQINWCAYCNNLKAGLEIDNPALQQQVVRGIIFNMGQLNVDDLVAPLYRLATTTPDSGLRELTGLALFKIQHLYGNEYLQEKLNIAVPPFAESGGDLLQDGSNSRHTPSSHSFR